MLRYVILRHECPPDAGRSSHWDLMFETEGRLRTWAVSEPPDGVGTQRVEALADHRIEYLDFEGPLSGGRGVVRQWDRGTYVVERTDEEGLTAWVRGERLTGRLTLVRLANTDAAWHLTFHAG